jgi:hypothetical protein
VVEHGADTSHSVIFPAWMLSLTKVPLDGRYQFHALFPDWNGPVGNLGPASSGAFSLTAKRRSEASAALGGCLGIPR